MTTNGSQHQMIQEAMKAIAERRPGRSKLVYDKAKRTIVAVAVGAQQPRALDITADDADMFGVVSFSGDWLRSRWPPADGSARIQTRFTSWDEGDAYVHCELGPHVGSATVDCAIGLQEVRGLHEPRLRIALTPGSADSGSPASTFLSQDGDTFVVKAYDRRGEDEVILDAEVVELEPALSARRAGLLESSILKDRSVLCVGLGTGGAYAAVELAKCGVGHFALLDADRLSAGNVVRHPGGISQTGRRKVSVVRDLILEKNPSAKVSAYPLSATVETVDVLQDLMRSVDVVICGTDNRPSKLLINRLCVEQGVVALYGGAFRRAYGGQVLRVRPRVSPCQQCFITVMPDQSADVEISSPAEAELIAYSDRPVTVEPGLSLDVLPIANFLTKLALMEILTGKDTSLDVLRRDYDAPWYLWLNRPEPGTQYAGLVPLSESSDEMTINRWYGIYLDRDPACPACGDFVGLTAAAHGIDLSAVSLPAKS